MFGRFLTSASAVGAMALVTLMPSPSRAQSAGAMLGGLAGGVLGGMFAGSMAAQAARHPQPGHRLCWFEQHIRSHC